jgi:hypothetical protein
MEIEKLEYFVVKSIYSLSTGFEDISTISLRQGPLFGAYFNLNIN